MPMPLPHIEMDDPRVVALAKWRQQLSHEGVYNPTWDELTDEERGGSLPDARNYLKAAIRAGLVPDTEPYDDGPSGPAAGPPRWTLVITCPRPKNRARDDFHTRPEKVARIAAEWFGPDAELTLTARTVRLTHTLPRPIENVAEWSERLATVLDCLYLDTRTEDGGHRLPRPVRTEIHEREN